MTTITLERAFMIRVLEQLDVAQALLERSQHHAKIAAMYEELRAALAAPATAPDELERKPMTDADIEAAARRSGATAYTNRFVNGSAFSFGPDALRGFVRAVESFPGIKEDKP